MKSRYNSREALRGVLSLVLLFVLIMPAHMVGHVSIVQAADDEEVEVPTEPTATGSVTVCKVVADESGNLVDANSAVTLLSGTFSVSGMTPAQTSEDAPVGDVGTFNFGVPLNYNADLFGNDGVNDSECKTVSDLTLGSYYYAEESMSGGWLPGRYNDQFTANVQTLSDLHAYDGNLFDGDSSNDNSRDQNADGHFVLDTERPDRTLVVLNQPDYVRGSIRVCKLIADENGIVFTANSATSSPEGTFTVSGIIPAQTSDAAPVGQIGISAFTAPLTFNTQVMASSPANDADCVTYSDLQLGAYYYGEETITLSSVAWVAPRYNDQFQTSVAGISDFYSYDSNLFDGDSSNDAARNQDADGGIVLGLDRPNRTLVILNQLATSTPQGGGDGGGGGDNSTSTPTSTTPTDGGGGGGGGGGGDSTSTPTSTTPTGGGGGGGGGGYGGTVTFFSTSTGSGAGGTPQPQGEVLGASTCEPLLKDYLRLGQQNDPEEVKKLQQFLNDYMKANLPVTGYFGIMTFKAVNDFQVQYSGEVLKPWVPYGLPSEKTPTGYVFKTTKRMINNLFCPDLALPIPQLP